MDHSTRMYARVEDVPPAVILLIVLRLFVFAYFIPFSDIFVDGLSNHTDFSTSAAIRAIGEHESDRKMKWIKNGYFVTINWRK